MDRSEQNSILAREGITDVYWHGYVSYVGMKDGLPVCGIVAKDSGKIITTTHPISPKDYSLMVLWVKHHNH